MRLPKHLASLVSLLCVFCIPAADAFTGKPAVQPPTQTMEVNQLTQQVSGYTALVSQYGADKSPEMRERLADASLQMARIYAAHNEYKNAVNVYRHIILEYAKDATNDSRNIKCDVAIALHQIVTQTFFGNPTNLTVKEIEELRVLFTPFLNHSDPDLQAEAANSLIYLAMLRDSGPGIIAENTSILRQVINSESGNPSPEMEALVAQAMFHLGTYLDQVHKPADAKQIYRQLVKKYASSKDKRTKDYVEMSKSSLQGK